MTLATGAQVQALDISAGTSTGLAGSSVTSVTVGQSGGTGTDTVAVTTTTGTAVSLTNSDGAFRFVSVSANGGANGIIWNNTTQATGGLTVTGTGSAGTGGTVQNMSGADSAVAGNGIYLNTVANVSLSYMNLHDFQNDGIHGNNITGLTLSHTTITATSPAWNGNTTAQLGNFHGEGDVNIVGLKGSALIDNCSFDRAFYNTFAVFNNNGETLNRIVMTNNTFGINETAAGNNAVTFQGTNGTLNITFNSNTITAAGSDTFVLDMHGSLSSDLIMHTNTISNNHPNIVTGGGGVSLQSGGVGDQVTFAFNVDGNTFRDSHGAGFNIGTGVLHNGQTFSGTFNNNQIGVPGVNNSGSTTGNDLFIQAQGSTTNINITNNRLYQYNPNGTGAMQLEVGDDGTHIASATFVVTGNTISNPGTLATAANQTFNGIQLNSGPTGTDASKTCLTLYSNTVAGSGNAAQGSTDIRLRQRALTDVGLFGNSTNYSGAVSDTAAVNTFVIAQNGGTASSIVTNSPPHGFHGTCPP